VLQGGLVLDKSGRLGLGEDIFADIIGLSPTIVRYIIGLQSYRIR